MYTRVDFFNNVIILESAFLSVCVFHYKLETSKSQKIFCSVIKLIEFFLLLRLEVSSTMRTLAIIIAILFCLRLLLQTVVLNCIQKPKLSITDIHLQLELVLGMNNFQVYVKLGLWLDSSCNFFGKLTNVFGEIILVVQIVLNRSTRISMFFSLTNLKSSVIHLDQIIRFY